MRDDDYAPEGALRTFTVHRGRSPRAPRLFGARGGLREPG